MKSLTKLPLAEQLKNVGSDETTFFALFTLFLQDYFTGLREYSGSGYFDTVYEYDFHREYDPNSSVLLAEMVEKAAGFIPERKNKLIYELLVEPYALIYYQEQKESI